MGYTLQLELDAALENGDTSMAPQSLDSAFVPLSSTASRAAVLGKASGGTSYYSLTLAAGDVITAGLKDIDATPTTSPPSLNTLAGSATITIQPSNTPSPPPPPPANTPNLDGINADYVAPSMGTYDIIVYTAGADYSLVITRNAAFDQKNNGSSTTAQGDAVWGPITSPKGAVLGALDGTSTDWYVFTVPPVTATESPPPTVDVRTSTPLGGPSQPINVLYPQIQLWSYPLGPSNPFLPVAMGRLLPDGRNEYIDARNLQPGTYWIQVSAQPGQSGTIGEYFSASFSTVP